MLNQKAQQLAKGVLIALGLSIPISTATDGLLMLAILVLWVVSANYREKLVLIRDNPIALTALIVFALYAIGISYSVADWEDALNSLRKAAVFLFIVFLLPFCDKKTVRFSLYGFMVSMIVTLAISYLIWFRAIPASSFFKGTADNPVAFKFHITHNLLMAFAAFLFALQARFAESRLAKLALWLLCGFASFNVFVMVQGRTGQLVLLILVIYFLFAWRRWKGMVPILCTLLAIGAVGYLIPSSALHQRTELMVHEFSAWDASSANNTSIGQRLEFYQHSLALIHDHPIFGVGTGGFAKAYSERIKNTDMAPTQNPHNEYLMVAIQLGVVGLVIFLFMFYRQWRLAKQFTPSHEAMAKGMLLTIIVASLVTSTLVDHTEGLFYAWMSALLYSGVNKRKQGISRYLP